MSSTAIATVVKMMESVPEAVQNQIVEHLRVYIGDLQDEEQWDALFRDMQQKLANAEQRARREIASGKAKPMDYDRL